MALVVGALESPPPRTGGPSAGGRELRGTVVDHDRGGRVYNSHIRVYDSTAAAARAMT